MRRSEAARVAAETVDALNAGWYAAPDGRRVDLSTAVCEAVDGTVSYPPDAPLPGFVPAARPTRFEVRNETTLAATRAAGS